MPAENVLKFTQGSKGGTGKLSKWLHYFTTARGKKFSYRFMGTMAVGISTVFVSYQTFFIEHYIDFVRAYRNGLPLEVPEEMELLVDAAADRLKLPVRQATYLKSFMVSGFDVTTCGSMNSNYGGWIGIPINYLYNSTRDIDRFNIKLRTESIDWSSDHGKLLEKSIVLTEDEKMFGILRSILELQNYNHIHTTLVPSATVFGLYVSAQTLNNRYNLFKLPQVARGLVYCCLAAFAYGVYSFTTDTIKIQQTSKVDKALAALGSDVIEAGIRFYDKILNKNVALRELSGKDLYSVKGNEYPGILRYNMFPLTTRKLFLQQKLEELHKNEAAEKNNTAKETNSNQQPQNKPE